MPHAQQGYKAAISSLVIGFIVPIMLDVFVDQGLISPLIGALLSILSIVGVIEMSLNMNYWGISYLGGWLFGMVLIGPHLMTGFELLVHLIIGGLYIGLKMYRKLTG